MARKVISVSITEEQDRFMQENDIKPSGILQSEVNKLMISKLSPEYLKDLMYKCEQLENNMGKWQKMFYEAKDFIYSKGFGEEYNKKLME